MCPLLAAVLLTPIVGLLGSGLLGCDLLGAEDTRLTRANASEIAFLSRRIEGSAEWQLYTMEADGTPQIRGTTKLDYQRPAVSNDGSKIAYVRQTNEHDYELHVKDLQSGKSTLIANGDQFCGSAAWAPSRDKLAYLKNRATTNATSLYVADPDGRAPVALIDSGNVRSPAWSPEGKVLAFAERREDHAGIYTGRANGTDPQRLTDHGAAPVWSPDGHKIAFVSRVTGSAQIYVMNADGSTVRQLTHTVGPARWPGWPSNGDGSPVWSPNGQKIAFESGRNGTPDMYLINRDGSNQKRLTYSVKQDKNPTWSPSGDHLLFQSDRERANDAEIFLMARNGSNPRPLSNYSREDVLRV